VLIAFGTNLLKAGPNQYQQIDSLLTANSVRIPALEEKVSISVSDVPLEEFLRGIANSSGLNLDVQPGLNYKVVNNFREVKVKDVLLYVCRQYSLDLQISGSIISILKSERSAYDISKSVQWDQANEHITFDFTDVPIEQAVKEISMKTGKNVILAPEATGKTISGFITSRPLENALEKLAYTNGLALKRTDDDFFILEVENKPKETQALQTTSGGNRRNTSRNTNSGDYILDIRHNGGDRFSVYAENAPIPVVLSELSDEAGFSYFLTPNVEDVVTLSIKNYSVDEILQHLLKGTDMSFRYSNRIYLIGGRDMLDFQENKVIELQNRSIDKLVEYIPETISSNLTIVEFPELNSLFVSGPAYQIDQFEQFIDEIDKVVPVVLIEVIIMYVSKSYTISTGIQAGIGEAPTPTQGTLFPGVDLQIGSEEFNKMLDNSGWINLGKVTPNFYVTLKALEEQGIIDMESTPKLATLNGHEAELSIGNTEYYLEEKTSLYGTQNPQQTTSQEYKSINAELSIKIKPVVSADDQITLEVEVHQSDFTERISKTSPPGSVNRDFTSQIRVKDQEMILLGGLMEKRKSDSGSGTPFLSRLPVIKWFFSSRKHESSDSKLSVLIKPTIIN
jgi:type IV pilus assembly protein PilQ